MPKKDVFDIFSPYGRLAQISLKQAYGFVQYHKVSEGQAATNALQGVEISGRKIREFSLVYKKYSKPSNLLQILKSLVLRRKRRMEIDAVAAEVAGAIISRTSAITIVIATEHDSMDVEMKDSDRIPQPPLMDHTHVKAHTEGEIEVVGMLHLTLLAGVAPDHHKQVTAVAIIVAAVLVRTGVARQPPKPTWISHAAMGPTFQTSSFCSCKKSIEISSAGYRRLLLSAASRLKLCSSTLASLATW